MKIIQKIKDYFQKEQPVVQENLLQDFKKIPREAQELHKYVQKFDLNHTDFRDKQNLLMFIVSDYAFMRIVDLKTVDYLVRHSNLKMIDLSQNNALNYIFKYSKFLLDKKRYTSEKERNKDLEIYYRMIDYLLDNSCNATDGAGYNCLSLYIHNNNDTEELSLNDKQFDKLLKISPVIKDYAKIDSFTYALIMQKKMTDYQWNQFFKAASAYEMFEKDLSRYYTKENLQFLFEKIEDKEKLLELLSKNQEEYKHFLYSTCVCDYLSQKEKKVLSDCIEEKTIKPISFKI